jgi:hypothetical protein
MRLLEPDKKGRFRMTSNLVRNIPPYAILSHTWQDNVEEISFKHLAKDSGRAKAGTIE